MKKWHNEEYEREIEVIGFLRDDRTERYYHNGEEISDKYTYTYGCPVNQDGHGTCSKCMVVVFPITEVAGSGGDLEDISGDGRYSETAICPDEYVMLRLAARPTGRKNFSKGKFFD